MQAKAASAAEIARLNALLRAATTKKVVKFDVQATPDAPVRSTRDADADGAAHTTPSSSPSSSSAAAAPASSDSHRCAEHDRPLRAFCRPCQALLCDACFTPARSAHRTHAHCGLAAAAFALQDEVRVTAAAQLG